MVLNNYLEIRTRKAEKIKNSILKTLKSHGIIAIGQVDYNGNAISIRDYHDSVFMWIRIIWSNNLEDCLVQMSNIKFASNFQRQGIFAHVITNLKRHKYVSNIMIQSVSTDAMRNWCEKYKFKKRSNGDWDLDYYWKA